jgi:hypothetical protein
MTHVKNNDNKETKTNLVAEKTKRNFVNIINVSKHLICTICQEILDDPKRITCG